MPWGLLPRKRLEANKRDVREGVREVEEERVGGVVVDELDSARGVAFGERVLGGLGFGDGFVVHDDGGLHVIAVGDAEVAVEAAAGGEVFRFVAEVPLADCRGLVALVLEDVGEGDFFEGHAFVVVREEHAGDAGARGVAAGHERGARGRADGIGRSGVGEAKAFAGDAIDVGGCQGAAVATEVAVAEVVAEDHHNVGGAAGGGEGVGRGACGGDEFSSGDRHGAMSLGISYVLFEAVQGDFTVRLMLLVVVMLQMGAVAVAQQKPAAGPLRVLKSNPRWFADPTGKAVLLMGSHVWQNLQDNGLLIRGAVSNPPPVFDYDGYLDFLERHNHNFFRLWRWETTRWTDNYTGKEVKYCRPHPWLRTGPGVAKDGEPKFDLTKFNHGVLREAAVEGDGGAATAASTCR